MKALVKNRIRLLEQVASDDPWFKDDPQELSKINFAINQLKLLLCEVEAAERHSKWMKDDYVIQSYPTIEVSCTELEAT
jgi:hypothetical protein